MTHAIEAVGLTKWYGKRRGILDVDFHVEEGEVFGFLGPNGAGKTPRSVSGSCVRRPGVGARPRRLDGRPGGARSAAFEQRPGYGELNAASS
jgi:ABC-2 type transport system ATP-binding protein